VFSDVTASRINELNPNAPFPFQASTGNDSERWFLTNMQCLSDLLKRRSLRQPAESVDHGSLVGHQENASLRGSKGKHWAFIASGK
jgi:hypothetical protein